jgi:serine/threonine protein kinase
VENPPRPVTEGSSARTAYAFLRPLPSQRASAGPPAVAGTMTVGAREDLIRRLFPHRGPGGAESEGSHSVTGTTLGHFQLLERIGRGGMGAVFRAIDLRLDRVIALKVLSPEQSHDPGSVQRFQNEARAAAKLDHDNIAQVYYIGEDQGLHYIAFEFITGTNVRELLARTGVLPIADAVSYTIQIAEALRSTAMAGVVHRDIKPSNIIIEPSGRATLVDLGLARQSRSQEDELTVAGTTLGTFDYISPEQALDPRNVDVRSDIYSLGCTLFHMVTGEPPYPSRSMFQKVVDHHGSIAPDPATKNRRISSVLSQVIRKMMTSDPDGRYPTPEALIRELQPVARQYGVRPVQAGWEIRPPVRNWLHEHRGWLAAVTCVMLLGFAINKLPTATDAPARIAAPTAPDKPGATDILIEDDGDGIPSFPITKTPLPQGTLPEPTKPTTPNLPAGSAPSRLVNGVGTARQELTGVFSTPGKLLGTGESPAAPAIPAVKDPVFWVASPETGKDRSFRTLEAACTAATDGATIEIRANGVLPEPQGPIRIERKRLRIRPTTGMRPTLEFKDLPMGSSAESRWFTIEGGSLDLADCNLTMKTSSSRSSDRWAIFSLDRCQSLSLRGVTLTVQNEERPQPAAFIEVTREQGGTLSTMMVETTPAPSTVVDVQESLFRGGGDVVYSSVDEPVTLNFGWSAICSSGGLFRIELPMRQAMMTMEERPISLQLDHVTAVLDQPLVSMSIDRGRPPLVSVSSDDSVITVRRSDRPLVSMTGSEELDIWSSRLEWRGNGNYFHVGGTMWDIAATPGGLPMRAVSFKDWSRAVTVSSNESSLPMAPFESSDLATSQQLSQTTPAAFALKTKGASVTDRLGRQAGVDVTRLPTALANK